MICFMSCEADEQFEPQSLSLNQGGVIARFETVALVKGVRHFAAAARIHG
jgi:hypothetical protein